MKKLAPVHVLPLVVAFSFVAGQIRAESPPLKRTPPPLVDPSPSPIPAPTAVAPIELVAPAAPRIQGQVDEAKQARLKESLATWLRLKKECGGNYSYTKRWSSWVGFGHETVVIARSGQVAERHFKAFSGRLRPVPPGQVPAEPQGKSWSETGKTLGSHKEGHPPKTLDRLYEEAQAILAKPVPPFHRLGLRFDKQGLLLACYLQDARIADDAPTKGVNVTSIKLNLPAERKAEDKQARIRELEQRIAALKDLAERARFTPEGHKKFLAKLAGFEKELAALKSGKPSAGKRPGVPTYEEWLAGGKKIPPGMVFTGGTPWFNERTGQRRQPREVYDMLYGHKGPRPKPPPGFKPPRPLPLPIKPGGIKPFPKHWGPPPRRQTRDLRPLPGGYGRGSSTLARWIQENMERDRKRADQRGD